MLFSHVSTCCCCPRAAHSWPESRSCVFSFFDSVAPLLIVLLCPESSLSDEHLVALLYGCCFNTSFKAVDPACCGSNWLSPRLQIFGTTACAYLVHSSSAMLSTFVGPHQDLFSYGLRSFLFYGPGLCPVYTLPCPRISSRTFFCTRILRLIPCVVCSCDCLSSQFES